MKKEQFEQLLTDMGVVYKYSGNRSASQIQPNTGHINMSGVWIEEDFELKLEPDGVEIKKMCEQYACEYCLETVKEMPVIYFQAKANRWYTDDWRIKCQLCKKRFDFATFKAG